MRHAARSKVVRWADNDPYSDGTPQMTSQPCKLPALVAAGLALSLGACASDGTSGPSAGAPSGLSAAAANVGGAASQAASTVKSAASGIPGLVNVDLRNVLNDLAVKLNIDRSNVPVTIQLPITLAANVCGVSVNVLSGSTGGQANCTANTAPQELAQVVQQQSAAGGSVGGGAQGGSTAANGGAAPTAGASTGGAANTSAASQGSTETTTTPPN
jgi:hypothetical protein